MNMRTAVAAKQEPTPLKALVKRAQELYPNSRYMRLQWVRQTRRLNDSGRHALLTGGWKNGSEPA